MSGGSYDYLCFKEPGDSYNPSDAERMVRRLTEYGFLGAAEEVRRVFLISPSKELQDLMQAVEWRDSNDWGDDQVVEVGNRYHEAAMKAFLTSAPIPSDED